MKYKKYLILTVVFAIAVGSVVYASTHQKAVDETPKDEPTQVVEMAINGMVSTRIEKMESVKPILPETLKVDFSTVEEDGDKDLAYWLEAYNDQMIVETAKGKWVSKYVVQGNDFYTCDDAEKMLVPEIVLELSSKGATYTIDDKTVTDPVECALSGYDIVTADDLRFTLTSYGCLEYACNGYSVVLVKE